MDNSYLATEKTTKLLLKFAIPCVLSLLVNSLYNIVDQIFIGNSSIGAIGNTATTLVFPIVCIALAFGLMLGDGAAAYMSLCMGRGEKDKLGKIAACTILACIAVACLFMAIAFPLLSQILTAVGARTEEALSKSIEYARIILIGFPVFIPGIAMNSMLRADGRPQIAMASMILGALLNVFLDWLFVFPLNMGLTGAALATIIGQAAGFIFSLIFILRARNFRFVGKDFIPDFRMVLQVVKLGFSSFLTQASIIVITVAMNNTLAKYGAGTKYGVNDPQAILGIATKVFAIFVSIAVGVAGGAQPIVGFNYGAKRYDRVKELYRKVLITVAIVGIVATVIFQVFPSAIIAIFGTNSSNPENYIEFGVKTMRIFLAGILLTVCQKASAIFLQSVGKPGKAALVAMFRDVVCLVPLILLLPLGLGLEGVLWAGPIADGLGICMAATMIITQFLSISKLEKETAKEAK